MSPRTSLPQEGFDELIEAAAHVPLIKGVTSPTPLDEETIARYAPLLEAQDTSFIGPSEAVGEMAVVG